MMETFPVDQLLKGKQFSGSTIRAALNDSTEADRELLWSVASLAFFGFFRLGELLVDAEASYFPATHLSWEDVAVNDA